MCMTVRLKPSDNIRGNALKKCFRSQAMRPNWPTLLPNADMTWKVQCSETRMLCSLQARCCGEVKACSCSNALHPVRLIVICQYQQQAAPLGDTQHWDEGESATAS